MIVLYVRHPACHVAQVGGECSVCRVIWCSLCLITLASFILTPSITNLDNTDGFARKMVAGIDEKREQENKYLMATKQKTDNAHCIYYGN